MSILELLYVVGLFLVLISIHEWGHFIFAKRAGILAREFAIGFGPKLFSYKRGETTYSFRLLPIGGYVNMAGENAEQVNLTEGQRVALVIENDEVTKITVLEDGATVSDAIIGSVVDSELADQMWISITPENDPSDEQTIGSKIYKVNRQAMVTIEGYTMQIAPKDRLYQSKTILQRFLTIFAGPLMNIIFAFFMFVWFVGIVGHAWDGDRVKIGNVAQDMPAKVAGLQYGDEIVRINGVPYGNDWGGLTKVIAENKDKTMTWDILRDGKELQVQLMPQTLVMDGRTQVKVGIELFRRDATIGELVQGGWAMMKYFTTNILIGFKKLFTGDVKIEDLGGPVKTVQVTAEFAKRGLTSMVYWAGILSLYLGLFNLLPIPALDGSRILFLLIEFVRRKPIPAHRESMVHIFGFVLLMGFMVFITYYDIAALLK